MNHASAEFYKRAVGFLQVNPGMSVVIHAKPDPDSARRENEIRLSWFTYLTVRDLNSTLKTWRAILGGGGKSITVPCEDPEIFDPSYCAPAYGYRDPEPPSQDERKDISVAVGNTLRELRAAVPKSGVGRVPAPKGPEKPPAEWLRDYQANPPPIPVLSDAARKKFMNPE